MIERRDEELSHIYRDAEGPRPPQRVDDNILAASQRVAGTVPPPAVVAFSRRWGTPVAIAATVLVTSTVALMVFERQSGVDTLAKVPSTGRAAKVSPATPVRTDQPAKSPSAEPRAEPSEKFPPAEPRSAAAAPVTPSPKAAAPADRAKPATVETALSGERRATGQPARLPVIPPGMEILRKTDEQKPAPAAAPPAAASERARATQQAPVPDALRAFDQPPIRPAQAPASAPAPGANTLRESASTLQGAGAVGALTSPVGVSDARERTPEKWLADIRKLKTEGKAIEAERDLVEFKKRYPDYILPEDLR
jgi:hypothetical protein